jgi:hypothetical protein
LFFTRDVLADSLTRFLKYEEDQMKRLLCLFTVFIMVVLLSGVPVFAHYMYYDGNDLPYTQTWYYRIGYNQAYIKYNQDYLVNSDHMNQSYVGSAASRWETASDRVDFYHTSFSYSKVDVLTPTQNVWEDLVGEYYIHMAAAATVNKNLDGIIVTAANISYVNRTIKISTIYCNPYDEDWADYSLDRRKALIAHEFGHSLTLGHCDVNTYPCGYDSIMKKYDIEISLNPQSHDITDLYNRYPPTQ